jgi:hypothetical protein
VGGGSKRMTRAEYEKLAIGVETGYTDRNGTPIKVGDDIVIYHKCTKYVGREEIINYRREYVVGTGDQGYVYSGIIQRQYHTVRFSFNYGLEMCSTGKWKFLTEEDKNGNLKYVLIGDKKSAPKLTFEELLDEPCGEVKDGG